MAIEVPKEAEADVLKLQQYQQQLQFLMMQKQGLQTQVLELEHSMFELKKINKKDVYEIVGTIMVKRDKDILLKDLIDKKKTLDLRLTVTEKQVDKITKKTNEINEKVIKMVRK